MATKRKAVSKNKNNSTIKKIGRFLLKVMLWFFGISIFLVVLFKFVPVPFTPLMAIRAIETKMDGKEMYSSHDWVPLEEIAVNMQKAVIASEDGTFLDHNGFDFMAIEKAMKNNEKGKKLKGGSTISQQTAKNVFLWQGRSYLSKREAAGIAAILPNPRKFKANNSSSYIERRKGRIVKHMRYVGKLDY